MLLIRALLLFTFFTACNVYAYPQKIVIATLEYPPFIYSDNNQAKGPIVDKVIYIFDQLGVDVTIKIYPITRGLLMVKNGEVDAYFSLKKTPEREKELLFTNEPIIQQPFVFFINKNSKINWNGSIEDINKYRFGIVSNTSYGTVFDKYLNNGVITNIDMAQTFELNIKKLIAGRVDIIINSYDVGQSIINKLSADNEIIALSPPIEIINSFLAFTKAKDYSLLANQYDNLLSKINE
jgi:polar amino acid transport system substrate-binding protein